MLNSSFRAGCLTLLALAVGVSADMPTDELVVQPTPAALGADVVERGVDFAKQIAWTLSAGDGDLVRAAIDYGKLLKQATADLDVDEDFMSAMVQSLRDEHAFAYHVLDDLGTATRYSCIGVEQVEDYLLATFRHRPSSGVEYHRYHLIPVEEGVFRIGDIELVSVGEKWSDEVRRIVVSRHVGERREALDSIGELDRLDYEHSREVARVSDSLARHDGRAALAIIEELPDALRQSRRIRALTLEAVLRVDGAPFADVHQAAKAAFVDDPGIDLFAWRHASATGNGAEILKLHETLNYNFVPDSYRDALAAEVHLSAGDARLAANLAEIAVNREPHLQQAWEVLLDATLARMDFQRVREVLNVLESRFERAVNLGEDLRFAGYVESSEYAADAR